MRAPILLTLIATTLFACSKPVDPAVADQAEQAIPQFHMALNGGHFDDIYNGASDDLKKTKSQRDFVAILDTVHRKMGDVRGTVRQGWKADGKLVTLTYKTTYVAGEATEEFVVSLQGATPALAGYRINANALSGK